MPSIYEMLNSQETVTLGSGRESDLVFNDPLVSPRHCQISKVENGVYLIVDLNSNTGTYVNNSRTTTGFATENDSIKIGSVIVQIRQEIGKESIRSNQQMSSGLPPEASQRVKPSSEFSRSTDKPSSAPEHDANTQGKRSSSPVVQESHTIIGERVKENITSQAEARPPMNTGDNKRSPGFVGSSMWGSIKVIALVVVICVGAFLLLKVIITKKPDSGNTVNNQETSLPATPQPQVNETELTEDQKASLISAITLAANTEIEARQTLNVNLLERAYSGEALRSVRSDIQALAARDQKMKNRLEKQEFLSFRMSTDGSAEVEEIETWSSEVYKISTNKLIRKLPSNKFSQTVFLKRRDDGWVVDAIVFNK